MQHRQFASERGTQIDKNSRTSGGQDSTSSSHSKGWDRRRWTNLCMGMFFSFAASLQTNDPDWYLWIVVYTVPALLVISLAVKPSLIGDLFWRIVCSFTLILGIGFSIYLLVEFGRVLNPKVGFNPILYEEGKELLGVFIIIFWLYICREKNFTENGLS